MGIVHHANYLTYFEAGRVDWLHRRGISYENWVKRGIHLPVVDIDGFRRVGDNRSGGGFRRLAADGWG